MQHRTFKKTGQDISLLGFGMMRLPLNDDDTIDKATAADMVRTAIAGGINYFDTAYRYHGGESETFLAEALADTPREKYFLATKLPLGMVETREDAARIFDDQLARLQTGYFDFYLFHALGEGHIEKMERLGLYDLLKERQKAGQIRNLGFSFHDEPDVLEKLCDAHEWDFVQLQLNYLDWEMQNARRQYEILEERGLPCIVMEPVRGGKLADLGEEANAILKAEQPGAGIASWALRWVAAKPNVLCVLSGMSTPAQLGENIALFNDIWPLTEAQQAALAAAVAIFKAAAPVGCTACRYCMPCPSGVDIPGVFEVYNRHVFDGGNFGFNQEYQNLPKEQNAANCVACGACEGACPQHLPIIKLMRRIDEFSNQ